MKGLGIFFIIAGVITAGLTIWKINQPNDGFYIIDPSIFMSGFFSIFCFAMGIILILPNRESEIDDDFNHKTDHKCPRCKKEYDCYLRNEYDECPLAYYEKCMNCKLNLITTEPSMHTQEHPEREQQLADITQKESI